MKKSEIKAGVEYAYYRDREYRYVRTRRGADNATFGARRVRVSQEALDHKPGYHDNKCAVQGEVWRKGIFQDEVNEFAWFPAELNIKHFQDEWDVHEQWVEKNIAAEEQRAEAEAKRKAEWPEIHQQVSDYFGISEWAVRRHGNNVEVRFNYNDIVALVEAAKEKQVA